MTERLRINGRDVELDGPTPLLAYLAGLGVDWRAVAVEVNDRILDRAEFASTTLRAGDGVEIVRIIGGGSANSREMAPPSTPPGANSRAMAPPQAS